MPGMVPPTSSAQIRTAAGSVPSLIIDTDMAGDVDDLVAFAAMLRAVGRGEAKLLGVIVSSTVDTAAPAARAVLDRYGHPEVPVYAYQGATGTYNDTFTSALRNAFGPYNQSRTAYTDDLTGYRTILAAAPNSSVTVVCIGGQVGLSRLLSSPADGLSSLSGAALIASKVLKLVVMGGTMPTSAGSPEYNLSRDPASSQNVAANWPTPVVWMGSEIGGSVYSGPSTDSDPTIDPVAYGFQTFAQNGGVLLLDRRQSWDPLAISYAIYGLRSAYTVAGANGTMTIDGSGNNTWSATPGQHTYLAKAFSDVKLADELLDTLAATDLTPAKPRNRSSFIFPMTEGTGLAIADQSHEDMSARLGATTASAPAWTDLGSSKYVLAFNGTSHVVRVPYRGGFNSQQVVISAIVKPTAVTGVQQIMARSDWTAPNAVWQFAINAGKLQFVIFNSAGSGTAYPTASAAVTAGAWALVTAYINGTSLTLYVNGVSVLSTTMSSGIFVGLNSARILMGARLNSALSVTDYFGGQIAGAAYKAGAVAGDVTSIETSLRAIATAKSITLP
jgi:inosine-uridine nucleoside N-ribohydrolase